MGRSARLGKIYILRNEEMREMLVKVGKTLRTSEERATELAAATGVAGRFQVLFEEDVMDVDRAEQLVHRRLASYRLQANREFFRVPYPLAIRTVFKTCAEVNNDTAAAVARIRLLMTLTLDARRIMDVLAPHRGGNALVQVTYESDAASCDVSLGDAWRVSVTPELVRALHELLGPDRVILAKDVEQCHID